MSALKDSLYKIIHDLNKSEASKDTAAGQNEGALVRKKLNEFNNYMDTWKYDFIKNIKNRFDKFNLEPVKYRYFIVLRFEIEYVRNFWGIFVVVAKRELEKILTDEIMDTIRPKRLNVLIKGEKFDRINLKEKRIRRKLFSQSLLFPSKMSALKIPNKKLFLFRKAILEVIYRLKNVFDSRLWR